MAMLVTKVRWERRRDGEKRWKIEGMAMMEGDLRGKWHVVPRRELLVGESFSISKKINKLFCRRQHKRLEIPEPIILVQLVFQNIVMGTYNWFLLLSKNLRMVLAN